jgi:Helix-turn-helix domain
MSSDQTSSPSPQLGLLADYLTRADLAVELGLNERTLERWQRRNSGPPLCRMGRQILYRRQAVLAWLQVQEREPSVRTYHPKGRSTGRKVGRS